MAQQHQSVGLVLSGGGAKGIAHIGAIQALEDNNIPIDYISGTSMGAIVGGLYAAGYTPKEMMDLIKSRGFAYWSTGKIDEKLVYNFFRSEPSPALITIPIAAPDSTRQTSLLPTSMISPLPMNFAFMELFSAYTAQCGGNFNNLFVPFRCVTSDVYAKHKLVLSKGELGDAIRASMTFPTVFQPIELDSVLVYDGGIYDNFPVDVMREDFAPSFIIGCDVSSPNGKPKAGDLINQLEDMIMQKSDYNVPPEEGIRIKMDCQRFGLLDFQKADQIYQVGYDKTMSMIDSIKQRVHVRIPAETRTLRRRVFKSKTPYVRFDSVKVTGGSKAQDQYLAYIFNRHRADTFGIADAKLSYYQAITSGNLHNLIPHAVYNPANGLFNLDLKAEVKDDFRVSFGGYLTSSTNSMLYLSGAYSTLARHGIQASMSGWIGQSYMAGQFDSRVFLHTHIPSAVQLGAVIFRHKFYENDNLFYQDKMPTFILKHEAFGTAAYTWAARRSGKASVGVGLGKLWSSFYEGNVTDYFAAGRDRSSYLLGRVRLAYDRSTLDNPLFPSAGSDYHISAIGATGKYHFTPCHPDREPAENLKVTWAQAYLSAANYFNLGSKFALGTKVEALLSSRKLPRDYYSAIVNAAPYRPTPECYNAFNPDFRANSYAALAVIPIIKPAQRMQLRGDCHLFMPYKRIIDINGTAAYGKPLRNPELFSQLSVVYNFPFNASLSLYGNYKTTPGDKWNIGITFGAFILAPSFLK